MRCAFALLFFCAPALALAQPTEPPTSPHHADWLANRDQQPAPGLVDPLLQRQTNSLAETPIASSSSSRPCRTIFGYLPYWENPTPLRWDLLTHVACFSIEVNQFGNVTNTRGWPWWNVINAAQANDVKVVLVVALFDGSAIDTLISTPQYKQNFFENMRDQLIAGNADGLNIDFENGTTWQDEINDFMADLRAYLDAELPGTELTIATPAVNWSDRWDFVGLAPHVDAMFIMGYQFAGSWSSNAGPNAPLTSSGISITNTVDVQYAGVPPEKLILGVPYYGHHWRTTSSAPRGDVTAFIGSTRFFNDEPNAAFYGRLWDSASQTPWYRWFSNGSWNQVWYDDAESLGLKYQLALDRDLQGVGMWALGYDEGRDELWDQLALQFGGCGPPLPCDFDNDGDCDSLDFARFLFCLAGPERTFPDGHNCRVCDLDGDADVDASDLNLFQGLWTN